MLPWSCYAIDQRNTERHQTIGPCSKREILKREIHNAEIVAGLPETEIDLDAGVVVIALGRGYFVTAVVHELFFRGVNRVTEFMLYYLMYCCFKRCVGIKDLKKGPGNVRDAVGGACR